ncbi:Radical SAM domain-containing protein [Candidatus Magnetomorum sp. HK-1]|nr:Radical SAM domain-containing protein [Candidatus Magnetomorum sp. HK-1]
MPQYFNPEKDVYKGLCRCYIASKAGGIVPPSVMDLHPVSGKCNLNCKWCIGRFERENIEPLPNILRGHNMVKALKKILPPNLKPLWTSRFHICGSDSEPLLAGNDLTISSIRFLLQRKRYIRLITNGLLLDNEELIKTISRISDLSISLDVTNDDDYRKYKINGNTLNLAEGGYSHISNIIQRVDTYRKKYNTDLVIIVTFVATPKTYNSKNWFNCFKDLKKIGVDEIKVRDDLNKTFGLIKNLKNDINQMNDEINDILIKYNAPDKPFKEDDFDYCRSTRLWPTLAADGGLYPCAHTANSKYEPFADLLSSDSLIDVYQKSFYQQIKRFSKISDIGCERQCPPTIGSFNNPVDVLKILNNTTNISALV